MSTVSHAPTTEKQRRPTSAPRSECIHRSPGRRYAARGREENKKSAPQRGALNILTVPAFGEPSFIRSNGN